MFGRSFKDDRAVNKACKFFRVCQVIQCVSSHLNFNGYLRRHTHYCL